MKGEYLVHLSRNDRMYDYLRYDIFPGLGCRCPDGIRVFGTNGSNAVYIYEECRSNVKAVGKFFYSQRMRDRQEAERHLEREWNNLHRARSVLGGNHYVARPLGRNVELGCLLVTEFCTGIPLEEVINRAIYNKEEQLLHDKLRALAGFLAEMHNRSAQKFRVDFNAECRYFERLSDTPAGVLCFRCGEIEGILARYSGDVGGLRGKCSWRCHSGKFFLWRRNVCNIL